MKNFFLFTLILISPVVKAQSGYGIGDATGAIPIGKILNSSITATSFKQLNDRLLVVDFFGTWCAPCIKALPELAALQQKYDGKMRVLLIGNEAETKLQTFIDKRKQFTLPIVVDNNEAFTKLFQPPSYPYTIIVGKNGRVIAMPKQEEMTEANIEKWLREEENEVVVNTNKSSTVKEKAVPEVSSKNNKITAVEASENPLVQVSQNFMYAAKTGDATGIFIEKLKKISISELEAGIKTDNDKKAFWINLYNAYTQVFLKGNADLYKDRKSFFGKKQIQIANTDFSLDDIEHGILRRSKIKWSLGYLNKLFPGKTEKKLRVDKLDYRLHFALNCGAKSCPPIAFYKPENIDAQLDLATKAYLTGEAEYDATANIVKVPKLMSWFRHDFGGKKNVRKLLQQLKIVPADKTPAIKYKDYDWSLYLENYKN